MAKKKLNLGIIGLGLMGKEFASSVARWCHLVDSSYIPVLTGFVIKTRKPGNGIPIIFHEIEIITA